MCPHFLTAPRPPHLGKVPPRGAASPLSPGTGFILIWGVLGSRALPTIWQGVASGGMVLVTTVPVWLAGLVAHAHSVDLHTASCPSTIWRSALCAR